MRYRVFNVTERRTIAEFGNRNDAVEYALFRHGVTEAVYSILEDNDCILFVTDGVYSKA